MGAELTEATIPAEAGQWLIEASVSFTKGCYTGQELVARIDSRGGNVPRPLRGLLVDGDPAPVGASVSRDGKEVGHVTSSARSEALGAIALAPDQPRSVEVGASSVRRRGGSRPPRWPPCRCGERRVPSRMTHYEVLGVAPTAPIAEVRHAYVALARQHHPDRAGGDADADARHQRRVGDAPRSRPPGRLRPRPRSSARRRRLRRDRPLRRAAVRTSTTCSPTSTTTPRSAVRWCSRAGCRCCRWRCSWRPSRLVVAGMLFSSSAALVAGVRCSSRCRARCS